MTILSITQAMTLYLGLLDPIDKEWKPRGEYQTVAMIKSTFLRLIFF